MRLLDKELEFIGLIIGVGGRGRDKAELVAEGIVFVDVEFEGFEFGTGVGFAVREGFLFFRELGRRDVNGSFQAFVFLVHAVDILSRDALLVDRRLQRISLQLRGRKFRTAVLNILSEHLNHLFVFLRLIVHFRIVAFKFSPVFREHLTRAVELRNIRGATFRVLDLLFQRRVLGFKDLDVFEMQAITVLEFGRHGLHVREEQFVRFGVVVVVHLEPVSVGACEKAVDNPVTTDVDAGVSAGGVVSPQFVAVEHLGELHYPVQHAEEGGPVLAADGGDLGFGDGFFVGVAELFEDGGHFCVDGFLEFVGWVDAVVEPLEDEVEVFLGWGFERVLTEGVLHFEFEVVVREVV